MYYTGYTVTMLTLRVSDQVKHVNFKGSNFIPGLFSCFCSWTVSHVDRKFCKLWVEICIAIYLLDWLVFVHIIVILIMHMIFNDYGWMIMEKCQLWCLPATNSSRTLSGIIIRCCRYFSRHNWLPFTSIELQHMSVVKYWYPCPSITFFLKLRLFVYVSFLHDGMSIDLIMKMI